MRCDEAAESVSALCDGEMITPEAAAHIRTCAACAELMEQYIALGATLRREASLELCALPPPHTGRQEPEDSPASGGKDGRQCAFLVWPLRPWF
jgi:hypothetical protein